MFSKKLRSFLKDYLTFTSRERRGTLVLSMIILIQLSIIVYLERQPAPGIDELNVIVHDFETRKSQQEYKNRDSIKFQQPGLSTPVYFPFDPNTLTDTGWKQLGFKEWQIKSIRHYLEKGGKFRKQEDVSKIYGLTEKNFRKLLPFIQIPATETTVRISHPAKAAPLIIDLNTANDSLLEKLPMVGQSRAKIIIKYRDALGGFIDISQLKEVYGMDSTAFSSIQKFLVLRTEVYRKVDLNSDDLKHPYISYKLAGTIKAWRKQHGNFKDPLELRQLALVNEDLYLKLAPYLKTEN